LLTRSQFTDDQVAMVEHIKTHPESLIMGYMGAGKTSSTLTAYLDLLNSIDVRRMFVFAPLRVARKVWRDEINEWAHLKGLSISHVVGTAAERMKALRKPADIHTLNVENTQWLEAQFLDGNKWRLQWMWDLVVLDECQLYKSNDGERHKALRRLRPGFQRIVGLTGTPAPNGLHDLWGQYRLIDRGVRLGRNITPFRDRWFDCVRDEEGYTRWVPRDIAKDQIYKQIADITLALEDKSPRAEPNLIRVELSPAALGKYKRMEREKILEVAGLTLNAANAGALSGKLLQLANGAVYDKTHAWHEIHQEKIDALFEMFDSLDRALVAYSFVHDIERISAKLDKFCKQRGKKWTVLRTDDSLARWGRGEFDYGIIHPATGGHGLNDIYKSGVKDLVWFGLTNNLEYWQQLNARLLGGHRRSEGVRVHAIVCDGTKDAQILPLLNRKDATQEDLRIKVREWVKEAA
jgi:hypothetical protein